MGHVQIDLQRHGSGPDAFFLADPAGRAALEPILERLIAERRRRASFLPGGLFSDPAWDILLAMALADARQQRLTICNLCDRVDAPPTTALRWIATLTEAGLLVRFDDATDRRRKYLELSLDTRARMAAYCSAVATPAATAA
ncbi:MAG TPA: winged helix DNA-binding protein [Sphingomicrobium sp.]|nr:winged helix DNA-binding protein [Sphingomicrobium sp.]